MDSKTIYVKMDIRVLLHIHIHISFCMMFIVERYIHTPFLYSILYQEEQGNSDDNLIKLDKKLNK